MSELYYFRRNRRQRQVHAVAHARQLSGTSGLQCAADARAWWHAGRSCLRAALLDAHEEVDPLTDSSSSPQTALNMCVASCVQHSSAGRSFSDRYADATAVYQGAGRGFSPELIAQIIELATEGLKPDLTLLFDLSVEDSTRRTRRRVNGQQQGDRLDAETDDFHARVRDAYLRLARAEPERIKVVETNQAPDLTHERVKEIVVPFLRNRGYFCDDDAKDMAITSTEAGK